MRRSGGNKSQQVVSVAERHEAHCRICRHPRRPEIDQAFLEWTSGQAIAAEFNLSKAAVYRHAEATGLSAARREKQRLALDRVIEHVGEVKVSDKTVLAAIKLAAEMDGLLRR